VPNQCASLQASSTVLNTTGCFACALALPACVASRRKRSWSTSTLSPMSSALAISATAAFGRRHAGHDLAQNDCVAFGVANGALATVEHIQFPVATQFTATE
jgi:hypothetical protein